MKDISENADYADYADYAEKNASEKYLQKIDTFDNIIKSDSHERIDTFDDLKSKKMHNAISTFDDLTTNGESTDRKIIDYKTGYDVRNMPELIDQQRINQATENIINNDQIWQEKWKTLNTDEKRNALDHIGKALGKAYDHPEPPLVTKKMDAPNMQGTYGDGYAYQPKISPVGKDGVTGSDYGIQMNQDGMDPNTHNKLFGEEPQDAVETYGHEFRHSYQYEQSHRYEKGFKVDDPDKA